MFRYHFSSHAIRQILLQIISASASYKQQGVTSKETFALGPKQLHVTRQHHETVHPSIDNHVLAIPLKYDQTFPLAFAQSHRELLSNRTLHTMYSLLR